MNKIILLALTLGFCIETYSQPNIEWRKTYGGSNVEIGHSIIQTSDNNLVIAGYATSDNSGDVIGFTNDKDGWIIKIDLVGNLLWQKIIGGNEDDIINSIIQTSDNGLIVVGESNSDDILPDYGSFDYWVVKLDSSGNTVWENKYGGSAQDKANSIFQTSDGGYIICGQSSSTNGDISNNIGNSDFWIVKINSTGTIEWEKSFGGTFIDIAREIKQTSDGSYVVVGTTYSSNGDVVGANGGQGIDIWVIKLDSTGNLVWQNPLGGTGIDEGYSIQETSDGGYIVGGETDSINGDVSGNSTSQRDNFWVIKLNSLGNIEWESSPVFFRDDIGRSIIQTVDGGYLIVGDNFADLSDSNILTIKLDNSGNLVWHKNIGNPFGADGTGTTDSERAYSVVQTNDNGFAIGGYSEASENFGMGNDYYVIKIASDILSVEDFKIHELIAYPNPTSDILNINLQAKKIEVYDISGKILKTYYDIEDSIDLSDIQNGIYFVKFEDSYNNHHAVKIIKE